MKIFRAVLSVMLGNIIGLLLIALAGFLTVRLTPWGHWAAAASGSTSAELASKYGDPVALLEQGLLFTRWIVGPLIALIIGAVVGLLFRRAAWAISTLSTISLVVVLSIPTSLPKIAATLVYIALSWLAMRLVCLRGSPTAASAARVPCPQR